MKWMLSCALAAALTVPAVAADDKYKVEAKGRDPLTGEKVETKSKGKVESDGDFKEKSRTKVDGHTVEKHKAKGEGDGDYKSKTKVKGPDGKYESKTKVDK